MLIDSVAKSGLEISLNRSNAYFVKFETTFRTILFYMFVITSVVVLTKYIIIPLLKLFMAASVHRSNLLVNQQI